MNKTPKLRFKEFSGEWEIKKLGELTLLVKDGTHGTHVDVEEGPYLLSAKNIKDGKIIITSDDRKISYKDYDSIYKNYSLKENDILLSIVGTIGRVAVMPNINNIAFQRSVAILRFNLNSQYIYQYMNTNIFQNQLLRKQVVSAQPGIYLNDLKKLDISMPIQREQEKIAFFFSLIDKKISLQSEKVEMLKEYKKGMMQKIISRELRFKDDSGRDYPEWQEKKLGNYIVEYKEKTTENNQYPVLTSSRDGIVLQTDYFKDRQVTTDNNIGYHIIPRGYITYRSRSDDTTFKFNQNNIIDMGIVSYFYPVFCFNKELNDIYALAYMNNYLGNQIRKEIVGTSQLVLSLNKLKELKIKVPCKEEQNKIGNTLSLIDVKIEKEQEKLDFLNEYKKGLLQQMFV